MMATPATHMRPLPPRARHTGMSRFPHPIRRIRLRLTLLAVLALLFQQVALASYACAIVDVPAVHTMMSTLAMACQ